MRIDEIAAKYASKVKQIKELGPTKFAVLLQGREPFTLTVRITLEPGGGYTPELSHHVKASTSEGTHAPSFGRSMTVEGALEEAIVRGLMTYRPDDESVVFEFNRSYA